MKTSKAFFGAVACLSLISMSAWAGLTGDEVLGNLVVPTAPTAGNFFSINASGNPVSTLPTSAIVGPGVEFGYNPAHTTTFTWSVTANISDNRITINESYADPSPGSTWLVEITDWTLTLSGLDWAGAPGIASPTIISQDPHISLLGFDPHSVQFHIDDVSLYVTGPYSYSRTTVVQVAPIPEPAAFTLATAGLLLIASLRHKSRKGTR